MSASTVNLGRAASSVARVLAQLDDPMTVAFGCVGMVAETIPAQVARALAEHDLTPTSYDAELRRRLDPRTAYDLSVSGWCVADLGAVAR